MAVTADIAHRIPAGWYPDRVDPSRRRWWNGVEWTEYYSANPSFTTQSPAPRLHSLRSALTFKDRVAGIIVGTLLIANLVVIAVLAHLF